MTESSNIRMIPKKRILWLTSIVLPKAAKIISMPETPFGGWVSQMIDKLSENKDYIIAIAMKSSVKSLRIEKYNNITFYYVPQCNFNKLDVSKRDAEEVINNFKPDLIHAEGSEMKYSNTFLKIFNGRKLVSLQGILNGYEQYESGNLNFSKIIKYCNPYDFIFLFLFSINKKLIFNKRLKIEIDTIKSADYLLGRTNWDRAHSFFYNPSAMYFKCNRILRPTFYSLNKQDKIQHSIFIGNCGQARKGAHFVMEAISYLIPFYPNIRLYIAGHSFLNDNSIKTKLGYRGYLKRLIRRLKIENNVQFLGILNEQEMANIMSKMEVFVMSSIIENSPNTLGEAMILKTPVIASYNGGVPDMCEDGKEGILYRANDSKNLAFSIKKLLDNPSHAHQLAQNAFIKSKETHNPEKNYLDLLDCYKTIFINS